ncbi:MAG: hypothetical protein NW206_09920 [Hyphomonadaceae bacterium]|nr:hypothetical protein [Hyphomonadaceae bacterium]
MAQKASRRLAKRLKVFVTRIGLHEWAVAVSSQKAALKAWDVRENLFASGAAKETHDAAAIEVAMRNPGEPVRVPGPKVVVPPPANVVQLEGRRPKPAPQTAPVRKRDRSKLDAAEEALVAYRKEAKKRLAEMDRKRRRLEDEISALESEVDRQTRALESRVARERKHYEA